MLLALLIPACTESPAPTPTPTSATLCEEDEVLDGELCLPEACGAGMWGDLPVDGLTVYVDVGAAEGGDGSEAAPLTSVQAGVDSAGERDGGLVAVAAGTYSEVIAMGDDHKGVTLAGRCREMVTIDGSGGDKDDPAIAIIGDRKRPKIAVEGLTVTGGRRTGVWVAEAEVSMTATDVRASSEVGVLAVGADLALNQVGVYDTLPDRQGYYGQGLSVEGGAALTATGCTIQGNTGVGIHISSSGTTADLADTMILDGLPSPDGTGGNGIDVQEGAALTATGCTIQGNTDIGVFVASAGSTVELVNTTVRDTAPSPDGQFGFGIEAIDGGALTATDCTVQGNTAIGIGATDPGTTVDLVDTAVLDTTPGPNGTGGYGVQIAAGATFRATGGTLQGNSGVGVSVTDAGTTVDLSETEILDTAQSPDGTGGRGINVVGGAALSASGCTVQGNTESGVTALDAGTTVDLVDTRVLDTRRGRDAGLALGVATSDGAQIRVSDCEISGTEGPGLYVVSASQVQANRLVLTGNAYAGALVLDGSLSLTASTITDTVPDPEWGGGFGVYVVAYGTYGPTRVTVADSTIGVHDYAAVWLDGPGTYEIENNTLSGSAGVDQNGHALHGNAVFAENGVTAWDGNSGLQLLGNNFSGATEVAVLLNGSSAALDGNSWSSNGTDIRQQDCDGVARLTSDDVLGAPFALVCPEGNVLTAYDLRFSTLYLYEVEVAE